MSGSGLARHSGAVLRDVFHTLWHPTGQGKVNRCLTAGLW